MADPTVRRIAVVTSSRAEYGLLYWTMRALAEDPRAILLVIATGTHLSRRFGHTIDAIRADGFAVAAEVAMDCEDLDGAGAARAAGQVTRGMADAFAALRPDIVLVLGDRFEILAAAQAAYLARIPLAHIHGGEVTGGSFDDGIRHAITKLSRLHLTTTQAHRQRILQLGEDPQWVHTVGAPGIENLSKVEIDDRSAFERRIGMRLGQTTALVTYHPATAADEPPDLAMQALLDALFEISGMAVLATGSNADPGAARIMTVLAAARERYGERLALHDSLGVVGYASALAHCDLTIGNSSSGLIEAPSAGIPTVNIGLRQQGRPRAPSVIDCTASLASIRAAVAQALSPRFRAQAARRENPYAEKGLDVSRRIVEHLLGAEANALRAPKPFVDIVVAGLQ